jgi:sulfonate transport system ATP-binding protein
VQRIWSERKKTIVFVTHNVREAVTLGDRVVLMTPHPGRVQQEFPVDLPRPRDPYGVPLAERASRITEALRGYLSARGGAVA